MIPQMDTLLANYEQGLLSRRELLQALALVAAPAGRQAANGVLRGRNLNHVNLQVADVDRSVEFYRTLFSLPPKRAVPTGPSWSTWMTDRSSAFRPPTDRAESITSTSASTISAQSPSLRRCGGQDWTAA